MIVHFLPFASQGKPVYANYGRKEDFANLSQKNIPLNGSVVLVRAGKLTFAEKVSVAGEVVLRGFVTSRSGRIPSTASVQYGSKTVNLSAFGKHHLMD